MVATRPQIPRTPATNCGSCAAFGWTAGGGHPLRRRQRSMSHPRPVGASREGRPANGYGAGRPTVHAARSLRRSPEDDRGIRAPNPARGAPASRRRRRRSCWSSASWSSLPFSCVVVRSDRTDAPISSVVARTVPQKRVHLLPPSIGVPSMVLRDGWRGIHRKVDLGGGVLRGPSDTCSASFAGHRRVRLPRTTFLSSRVNSRGEGLPSGQVESGSPPLLGMPLNTSRTTPRSRWVSR